MTSRAGRRQTDPELGTAQSGGTNVPAVIAAQPEKPDQTARDRHASAFGAQLYGQPGEKRGLRGGEPVLNHARSAYLEAEYSGPADRRPPRGMITRKEI